MTKPKHKEWEVYAMYGDNKNGEQFIIKILQVHGDGEPDTYRWQLLSFAYKLLLEDDKLYANEFTARRKGREVMWNYEPA